MERLGNESAQLVLLGFRFVLGGRRTANSSRDNSISNLRTITERIEIDDG